MGCGCSMFEDRGGVDSSTERQENSRTRNNESLEFTNIHAKEIDSDACRSVYCPPPPDWALNDSGVETKKANLYKIQQSKSHNVVSNGATNRNKKKNQNDNPWYRIIDEANADSKSKPETSQIVENVCGSESHRNEEEIVVTISQPSPIARDALDALSRPKSVQSIPATLSDPGPLTTEDVGHRVPFNQNRKTSRHGRQLAVDDPINLHYHGQYSTLV